MTLNSDFHNEIYTKDKTPSLTLFDIEYSYLILQFQECREQSAEFGGKTCFPRTGKFEKAKLLHFHKAVSVVSNRVMK